VLDEVPIEIRDFTDGKAKALYAELTKLGAVFVKNQQELLHMLNVSEEKAKAANGGSAWVAKHLKPTAADKEKI